MLENGRTTAYAYDAASRLTQVAHDGVITLDYALNAVGNRTFRGESIPGGGSFTDAYGYDAQRRLGEADGTLAGAGLRMTFAYDGWSLVAEFDAAGTEAARYGHGAVIDEILAKMDSAGTVSYCYDGRLCPANKWNPSLRCPAPLFTRIVRGVGRDILE